MLCHIPTQGNADMDQVMKYLDIKVLLVMIVDERPSHNGFRCKVMIANAYFNDLDGTSLT